MSRWVFDSKRIFLYLNNIKGSNKSNIQTWFLSKWSSKLIHLGDTSSVFTCYIICIFVFLCCMQDQRRIGCRAADQTFFMVSSYLHVNYLQFLGSHRHVICLIVGHMDALNVLHCSFSWIHFTKIIVGQICVTAYNVPVMDNGDSTYFHKPFVFLKPTEAPVESRPSLSIDFLSLDPNIEYLN